MLAVEEAFVAEAAVALAAHDAVALLVLAVASTTAELPTVVVNSSYSQLPIYTFQ